VDGCPEARLRRTLEGRYAVRRRWTEPVCLERGCSRRIHFVPLRLLRELTGEYQQDHRRSRLGSPTVSLTLVGCPVGRKARMPP
jgi:hypothetical protein